MTFFLGSETNGLLDEIQKKYKRSLTRLCCLVRANLPSCRRYQAIEVPGVLVVKPGHPRIELCLATTQIKTPNKSSSLLSVSYDTGFGKVDGAPIFIFSILGRVFAGNLDMPAKTSVFAIYRAVFTVRRCIYTLKGVYIVAKYMLLRA